MRRSVIASALASAVERKAKRDPRASLEERYGSHSVYVKRLQEAAEKLVSERLLLREDAQRVVATAASEEIARRFAGAPADERSLARSRE